MSVARDLFDLRIAGAYLPSIVLFIVRAEIDYLYPLAFFSLLWAVYFHGLSRNVFGVGGPEENPMKRDEAIQGIQVALSGKGPHSELPDTLWGMVTQVLKNPLVFGVRSLVFILAGLLSFIVWLPSVAVSLYTGWNHFHELGTGAQIVVFAEFVWVLQWLLWRFFSPSYLLDEEDFE